MDNLVYVEVLGNDEGGHKDLVFQVQGLTERWIFDTYYFVLAVEPVNELGDVRRSLAGYLSLWVIEIKEMEDDGQRFFPIDVSDQYTGCLRVQRKGVEVELDYGYSTLIEGCNMDLNAPRKYFTGVSDFQPDTSLPVTCDRVTLIRSLTYQIARLKDEVPPFTVHH